MSATTIPRKLTAADKPQLIEVILIWKKLMGFALDRAQLGIWATEHTFDQMRKAFTVTRGWLDRDPGKGRPISESETYRYCNSCLRRMTDAAKIVDDVLGGAL
jgi:hypothetical protein